MKTLHIKIIFCLFAMTGLFTGCSNTKFLTGDQILYTGVKDVKIVGNSNKKEIKPAINLAKEITSQEPNNGVFGKRVLPPLGLWTYNYKKPEEGKKPNFLYRTLAEEPVLISTVDPNLRSRKIDSELFGIGFFKTNTWFELDTMRNPKKAKITYITQLETPFRINTIISIPPHDQVDSLINIFTNELEIKQGDVFNLEIIKSEKQKMAAKIVEQGYYFFNPDYIEIIADTANISYQVDLLIRKSPSTPMFALKTYTINNVSIFVKGIQNSGEPEKNDTTFYEGICISGDTAYLKPQVITKCILLHKGDRYSNSKHQGIIPLLNNYGVFEYAKMHFSVSDSLHQTLDLDLELAAKKEVSLNIEANVQAKSTGFTGPLSEITLAHSNIAHGANRLQLKLFGGFEWQWGSRSENDLGANSYNAGINSSIVFPRLLLPFKIKNEKNLLVAKTVTSLGYEFINNVTYYRMNSLNMGFGYQWNKQKRISNMFKPLKINLVSLLETTPKFDSIINENPYVKKSFEEQTIVGTEYQFTYDNSVRTDHGFYFQGIIGTSGNLIDIFKQIGNDTRPYSILENIYSQFIKLTFDFRYYTISTKKGIALRLYTGTGFSYGNSEVMPYIEQYYSGGSNSLRGFVARSLGPGSYKPEEQNGIIDQTGDIKLEFNAEYRFKLSKLVYGAYFLESGNVWLLNEDANRPGSGFAFNTFANQLAVGTGLGLRFDFDFFVLRTDLGFPLRKPYETDGKNWLPFNDIFKQWRFNLAIGLPY